MAHFANSCLFLLGIIAQNSAKHTYFRHFLGAAAIQERPLLAWGRHFYINMPLPETY